MEGALNRGRPQEGGWLPGALSWRDQYPRGALRGAGPCPQPGRTWGPA